MRLIGFAIYLGMGALLHALCVGPQFDWTSAWTFGWLFGWPLMLFIWFWAFMLGFALLVTVIACLYMWLESFAEWRERRRKAKCLRERASP